jgi:ABC-2 type transport system ATP-binding protein
MLEGMQLDVTLRVPAERDPDAVVGEIVGGLPGVREVEPRQSSEAGKGIVAVRIHASGDIRDALCKKVIEAGVGLLELSRAERELESVFLRLAESDPGAPAARRKKRKARAARAEKAS